MIHVVFEITHNPERLTQRREGTKAADNLSRIFFAPLREIIFRLQFISDN